MSTRPMLPQTSPVYGQPSYAQPSYAQPSNPPIQPMLPQASPVYGQPSYAQPSYPPIQQASRGSNKLLIGVIFLILAGVIGFLIWYFTRKTDASTEEEETPPVTIKNEWSDIEDPTYSPKTVIRTIRTDDRDKCKESCVYDAQCNRIFWDSSDPQNKQCTLGFDKGVEFKVSDADKAKYASYDLSNKSQETRKEATVDDFKNDTDYYYDLAGLLEHTEKDETRYDKNLSTTKFYLQKSSIEDCKKRCLENPKCKAFKFSDPHLSLKTCIIGSGYDPSKKVQKKEVKWVEDKVDKTGYETDTYWLPTELRDNIITKKLDNNTPEWKEDTPIKEIKVRIPLDGRFTRDVKDLDECKQICTDMNYENRKCKMIRYFDSNKSCLLGSEIGDPSSPTTLAKSYSITNR